MVNYGVGSLYDLRKKLAGTYEFISTAYHEAGHTIYGLLHFMRIPVVYIFNNKKTKRIEGFTRYEEYFDEKIVDPQIISNLIKNEICISYAGLEAERHHFKMFSGSDKLPMILKDGSSDDTLTASELIRKFNLAPPGQKRYLLKKKLSKETYKELQLHWDAVTIVAHALFQRKKIYYDDLKELLTKKGSNKKFWKEKFKQIDYIFENAGKLDEQELKSILLIK